MISYHTSCFENIVACPSNPSSQCSMVERPIPFEFYHNRLNHYDHLWYNMDAEIVAALFVAGYQSKMLFPSLFSVQKNSSPKNECPQSIPSIINPHSINPATSRVWRCRGIFSHQAEICWFSKKAPLGAVGGSSAHSATVRAPTLGS